MTRNYDMPRHALCAALIKRGWLPVGASPSETELADVVAGYQEFNGEFVDGWAGAATERSLRAIRYCQLPDKMEVGEGLARWGKNELTWNIEGPLHRLNDEQLADAFADAFKAWTDRCGLAPATRDERNPDIHATTGPIDRAGGTLAWSELPGRGTTRPLNQKYDTRDTFVRASNPGNSIDALAVIIHEIGHALGLPHRSGNGTAIMNPIYKPGLRTLQPADIQDIQARYGKSSDEPDDDEPKTVCDIFWENFFNLSVEEQRVATKLFRA